jgi:CheY-like chemotaxis protein
MKEAVARKRLALIVDDLRASRQDMMLHLEALGHEWLEAGCVQEARELLKKHDPDYVLLDLQLPMNANTVDKIEFGKSFLDEIIKERPLTPIVVVTGHGATMSRAMDVVHRSHFSLVTFVPKPFVDDDPTVPNLTYSIKLVLDKAERLKQEGLPAGLKSKPEELPDCEIGTIDVRILDKPNHQQVVCTVNGKRAIFSPKEQEILAIFAMAQEKAKGNPNRHLIEVDSGDLQISNDFDNRHTVLCRLRKKRIKPLLPKNHPPVMSHGKGKGMCVLGCYCIDSSVTPRTRKQSS